MARNAVATIPTKAVRKKGAARRQQIIDLARHLLIETGVSGLVLRDISERIGITHGNLQYYFATKDDLIIAVYDQEVSRYTSSMHDALDHTSTREGRIAAIIDSAINEMRSGSTPLWTMLFSLALQNDQLRDILRDLNERYDETLAAELSRVDDALSEPRRRHLAQMIRMMVDGLAIQTLYADADSATFIALQAEIKASISAWFNIN